MKASLQPSEYRRLSGSIWTWESIKHFEVDTISLYHHQCCCNRCSLILFMFPIAFVVTLPALSQYMLLDRSHNQNQGYIYVFWLNRSTFSRYWLDLKWWPACRLELLLYSVDLTRAWNMHLCMLLPYVETFECAHKSRLSPLTGI